MIMKLTEIDSAKVLLSISLRRQHPNSDQAKKALQRLEAINGE